MGKIRLPFTESQNLQCPEMLQPWQSSLCCFKAHQTSEASTKSVRQAVRKSKIQSRPSHRQLLPVKDCVLVLEGNRKLTGASNGCEQTVSKPQKPGCLISSHLPPHLPCFSCIHSVTSQSVHIFHFFQRSLHCCWLMC